MLSEEASQRIKVALTLAVVVAALRTGYILYERHESNAAIDEHEKAKNEAYADTDWYVSPKKLHPYDLKSAKQLTQQPVWVREGYVYAYYSYAGGRVNFSHDAGVLGPLQKLQIQDVVVANSPKVGRQVMAVFPLEGKLFAVAIGVQTADDFQFYSDDMFLIEDPHSLYQWPPEIWQAVDAHEAKVGMRELQVEFALGIGKPDGDTPGERTITYANQGKPMAVTFRQSKAVSVEPAPAGQ